MSAERDAGPQQQGAPAPRAPVADCGHLDEDAEACEDPVHSGDARHQHELHQQQRPGA